ncbi:MAG: sugar phosphate isomerase/epimerase [Clostridia bacterium]|nr:sugar phosphate isomerase/epimerase [Clostridia bacterium]
MVKSRITAAIWPWGTDTREQMETAAAAVSKIGYENFESVKAAIYAYDLDIKAYKEVLDKNNLKAVSFYIHLLKPENEKEIFASLDRELEFMAELGVKRICLQATGGRPEVMDKNALDYELDLIGRFAEKTLKYDIMSNLHPHHNTWVMRKEEIDNILRNLDSSIIQFAPDTAHLVAGDADPYEVIKEYVDRVNFTHFKDIKSADVKSEGYASAGMEVYSNFCELGKGNVDFKSIFTLLKDHGYDGPLCEELDQAPISNEISALNNFNFLMENY